MRWRSLSVVEFFKIPSRELTYQNSTPSATVSGIRTVISTKNTAILGQRTGSDPSVHVLGHTGKYHLGGISGVM